VTVTDPTTAPDLRPSVRATYDSRQTGPRYWVTTEINDRAIAFRERLADPFVRTTVHVHWRDLLRGLLRLRLRVTVTVGADREMANDVLELDENTLIPGRTRRAAFRQSLNQRLREAVDGD
jgi:hypothetical protein